MSVESSAKCHKLDQSQHEHDNNIIINNNKNNTMPQGKKWLSQECKTLAIAWIQTSEELEVKALKGTGQTGEKFWKKVMVRLEEHAPPENDVIGRYHNHGLLPVWNQWKDNVNRNVKGFNKSMLTITKQTQQE
jgi:hypothetical protein